MSTKFISVNGYEKIERIKGSKKVRKQLAVKTSEKKTKRMDNILSMLYYIVVVPATFFSGIVKFITPSKKNKRKSFSRKNTELVLIFLTSLQSWVLQLLI